MADIGNSIENRGRKLAKTVASMETAFKKLDDVLHPDVLDDLRRHLSEVSDAEEDMGGFAEQLTEEAKELDREETKMDEALKDANSQITALGEKVDELESEADDNDD